MSNVIPPLVSDSPPPPPSEDDEDDEFDDFRCSNDVSYGCDSPSLTTSPDESPKKLVKEVSSAGGQETEFCFEPVSSDLEKERSKHFDTNPIEVNESKNTNNLIEEPKNGTFDGTKELFVDVLQKNNFNRDNIPSQFIIESKTVQEIEYKCDKTKDSFDLHVDENITVDLSISNGISNLKDVTATHEENDSKCINVDDETNCIEENISDDLDTKSSSQKNDLSRITNAGEVTFSSTHSFKENEGLDEIVSESLPNFIHSNETNLVNNKTNVLSTSTNQDIEDLSIKCNENIKNIPEFKNDDEFGLFVSESSIGANFTENLKDSSIDEVKDEEDDFANFTAYNSDLNKKIDKIETNEFGTFKSSEISNDNTDEFANFDAFQESNSDQKVFDNVPDNLTTFSQSINESIDGNDDDFDDFGEFTSTTTDFSSTNIKDTKSLLLINEKDVFKKTEDIIKDMFVLQENILDDFEYFELGKGDNIFTQLQDITDTPALGYNWSKSTSQQMLLKALNIDSRNILYGHSWNSSVPKFAANLGMQPLEPVKMEPLTPTPVEPVKQTTENSDTTEVPVAEFDWNSSGLVNPLDYIEQLVASLDIPNNIPSNTSSPKVDDVDWDTWLKCTAIEPSSQPTKPPLPIDSESNEFEEFTSFQSTVLPTEWPQVELRETYISDVPQAHIDMVLQPTIVTPELPRKITTTTEKDPIQLESDNGSLKVDEEFDDFQKAPIENDKNNTLFGAEVKEEFIDSKSFEIDKKDISENKEVPPSIDEDDDFTEFHSSVPEPKTQPQQTIPLTPILQPVPVYNTNKTQINWPDPGITQEELKRFEEVFSLPTPQKEEKLDAPQVNTEVVTPTITSKPKDKERNNYSIWDSPPRSITMKKEQAQKQNSLDDDEWSDFVSVQKPSPIHKPKFMDRTQTASPDLPLSVLNLGNIQPTKQPIPVITPQGLVQTKLSTNLSPSVQIKSVNSKTSNMLPLQPSIISNQYASQAYGFGNAPQSSQNLQNGQDDDEWGDFVSSPLPGQYQNSNSSPHKNWGNFVANTSHSTNQNSISRVHNNNLQKKSNNVSGLVLPELDFLALKDRTGVTRKK